MGSPVLRIDELLVFDDPARFLEQAQGLADGLAHGCRPSVGRLVLAGEDLLGDLAAERLQDLQLVRARQAARRPARSWRSSSWSACRRRRRGSCSSTRSRRRRPSAFAHARDPGRSGAACCRRSPACPWATSFLIASFLMRPWRDGGAVVGGGPVLGDVLLAEVVLAALARPRAPPWCRGSSRSGCVSKLSRPTLTGSFAPQ